MTRKQYNKKYWAANKDRVRSELRTSIAYRYRALEARCKRENKKFRIAYKTYEAMINAGCFYCGADLSEEVGGGLDRLNNSNRNYTSRNVAPCCKLCNKVKSDVLTVEEMLIGMKAINKLRKGKKK